MIKKLQLKLSNKKSFTYMAYKVIQSKLFSAGLLFVSSIIIIRHLPKEDYGLYVLMMAFFAIFELFMGGFDASLVRFIPTSGKTQQHKLIATILTIKTSITIVILFSLYFLYHYSYQWLNIPVDKLSDYSDLYTIVSISFIFSYISTTTGTLLTSFMMYDLLFKLSVIGGVLALANSIFIWQFSYGIVEYVLVSTIISFVLALLNFYYLYSSKNLSFQKIKLYINFTDIKQTFIFQVWAYSTPLLGVSLLSYIKNYLPTYLFGTMVSLETLAVYSVFKKITDFLHKGYAGFIQGLYPKLFQMMHSKSKAIDKFFLIGIILRIVVFIALYFGYDLILSLYSIKESVLDSSIFTVLISVFLIMYFATFFNLIINATNNTYHILIGTIGRTFISLLLMFYLYEAFQIKGILATIFISTIIDISYLSLVVRKLNHRTYAFVFYIILFLTSLFVFKNV